MQSSSRNQPFKLALAGASPATDAILGKPKAENRNPKEIRSPRPEFIAAGFQFSEIGFLSAFGTRPSDFITALKV